MKSIKLSEYFKVVRPEYIYLKLTPATSVRNYDSDKIARTIANLHRTLTHRIRKRNKQYFFDAPSKVAYFMYLEKGKVEFYFIVPNNHLPLIKEKIGDTWKGITITQVSDLPRFSDQAIQYKLSYKKEDALSLAVDRRTNALLSSLLNVVDVMEENDKIGIFYNFVPMSQKQFRADYKRTIKKVELNYPVDREKTSAVFVIRWLVMFSLELLNTAFNVVGSVFGSREKLPEMLKFQIEPPKPKLSLATDRKQHSQVIKTQIAVMSDSVDKTRAYNSAYSVCESFRAISEDNELTYKRYNKSFNPTALTLPGVDAIITSPSECQNLIALPGRELLEEHKFIEKIDTFESEVPEELRKGIMSIGTNTYRGKKQKAYLTTDPHFKNLALVIIGPTRSGKTNLIINLAKDAVNNGECMILFDFCGNNELSDEVSANLPKHKTLNIDCEKTLQGLGYNEVNNADNTDAFKRYRNAKVQTSQLLTLVNSVNASDKELSAKMDRYLESAALIVFISNGPIKHVFATLQNHRIRHEYIDKIPADQQENLEEYVSGLQELDEKDKDGLIVGTRNSYVSGIIDRINKLKQNTYMEMMLKKDCSNNVDLVQEIQKNQLICLRMPEVMFSTETEKDAYCTYMLTKVWLALQIRKWEIPDQRDHTQLNLAIDELSQVPHTQEFARSKLSQMAKFSGKMIISCHYLGQIGIIRSELKAANSSYMLISGSDKDNFRELANELHPYTVDDLLNLKRYNSLNLIKYEQGYARFITHLSKNN